MRKKQELITIKVLKTDGKRLKVWAAQRGLKIYEVVNLIINGKANNE